LFDAVLIKDNHLAWGAAGIGESGAAGFSPAEAVRRAREFMRHMLEGDAPSGTVGAAASDTGSARARSHVPSVHDIAAPTIVEVEVDSLEQLDEVLPAGPDIVLLDNMSPAMLAEAVRRRDAAAPQVQLEASGGVHLDTVAQIARTGVDRISVGSLTHAAASRDVGLDWLR
jgi:nicotinate-nucleotide pyrophosphorylase (carboxylating)